MLDDSVRVPFDKLASLKMEEQKTYAEEQFRQKSEEMNARGMLQSSIAVSAYNEIRVEGIKRWVPWLWETLKRILEAKHVAYYPNLAQDLKDALESRVPQSLWDIPAIHLKNAERWKIQADDNLTQVRSRVLTEINVEIDLYVDTLRIQSQQKPPTKELDQIFKILFSREQAVKDFEGWQKDLEPVARPIAVLFVDIDKFKSFNERFLHTKVDQTILPEAQRLIKNLVLERGSAYKYAGDEYVLILPNHDLSEGAHFAEKVRVGFEEHSFRIDDITERLTVSVGVALFPADGENYGTVLEAANAAMMEAKKSRNSVRLSRELAPGRDSKQKLYHPKTKKPLSANAQHLAMLLSQESKTGMGGDPNFEHAQLKAIWEISDEELEEAADELQETGWAKVETTLNTPKGKFSYILPTSHFFLATDAFLTKWNPQVDAKSIAQFLIDSGQEGFSVSDIDKHFSWGPRRLNPSVLFLVSHGFVKPWGNGPEPYEYRYIYMSPATRRFLKEEV